MYLYFCGACILLICWICPYKSQMRSRSVRFNSLILPILYRTLFLNGWPSLTWYFFCNIKFKKTPLFWSIFCVIFAFNDTHRFVFFFLNIIIFYCNIYTPFKILAKNCPNSLRHPLLVSGFSTKPFCVRQVCKVIHTYRLMTLGNKVWTRYAFYSHNFLLWYIQFHG